MFDVLLKQVIFGLDQITHTAGWWHVPRESTARAASARSKRGEDRMVFLGVVLAAAAVVVAIGLIAENSSVASLSLFGHHVPGVHTEARVVIAGMIVAAFVGAGLTMSSLSLLRSMRARRELRDLRDERQESMSALQMQNQQLQRELARARAGAGNAPVTGEVPVAPRRGRDREPVSPFFDQPV
jgi:uncharacterized integral membrane protein